MPTRCINSPTCTWTIYTLFCPINVKPIHKNAYDHERTLKFASPKKIISCKIYLFFSNFSSSKNKRKIIKLCYTCSCPHISQRKAMLFSTYFIFPDVKRLIQWKCHPLKFLNNFFICTVQLLYIYITYIRESVRKGKKSTPPCKCCQPPKKRFYYWTVH